MKYFNLKLLCKTSWIISLLFLGIWLYEYYSSSRIILSPSDADPSYSPRQMEYKSQIKIIGQKGRLAFYAHPPSRLEWTLRTRAGKHSFHVYVGLDDRTWTKTHSDGIEFRGIVSQAGKEQEFFSRYINPIQNPDHRSWIKIDIPFQSNGKEMILALENNCGPHENYNFDWAYWAEPQIEEQPSMSYLYYSLIGFVLCFILQGYKWIFNKKTSRSKISVYESAVLICIGVACSLGIIELLFQFFPGFYPLAITEFLPDKGFHHFKNGSQLTVYNKKFGIVRQPNIHLRWRRVNDLVFTKKVSPAYEDNNLPIIDFQTDSEGFRNPRDVFSAPIVAVGDSFTEAPSVQRHEIWTTIVSEKTGLQVRNLGISGYGPQQCLSVLQSYGIPHNPKLVLFPLFEGNDIQDAEQFQLFQNCNLHWPDFRIKLFHASHGNLVYTRASFTFVWPLLQFVSSVVPTLFLSQPASVDDSMKYPLNPVSGEISGEKIFLSFEDRFLYHTTFSIDEWRNSTGWKLCSQSLRQAKDLCEKSGAILLVLLFPSKGSIYLPLLSNQYQPSEFNQYVSKIGGAKAVNGKTWHENFLKNRSSLGQLVNRFCSDHDIHYLNLIHAFEEKASEGKTLFFPLDTHWNPEGHQLVGEIVAREIMTKSFSDEMGIDHK